MKYLILILSLAFSLEILAQPYGYYSLGDRPAGKYLIVGQLGTDRGIFLIDVGDEDASKVLSGNVKIVSALLLVDEGLELDGERLRVINNAIGMNVQKHLVDFEEDFRISESHLIKPFLVSYRRQIAESAEQGDTERIIQLVERLNFLENLEGEYRFTENATGQRRLHVLNGVGTGLIHEWSLYSEEDVLLSHRGLQLGESGFVELKSIVSLLSKAIGLSEDAALRSTYELMKDAPFGVGAVQEKYGWRVMYIQPNSIAEILGLQVGDLIAEVDGSESVKWTAAEFQRAFKAFKRVTVNRNGRLYHFDVEGLD